MLTKGTTAEQFWFAVRKAATVMERRAEAVLAREVGVSLASFMVLSVLEAADGPTNQQQIAARLGLTKGTVSRLVENAVREGHARTRVSDVSRRERIVEPTEAGLDIVWRGDAALGSSDLATFPQARERDVQNATSTLYAYVNSLGEADR